MDKLLVGEYDCHIRPVRRSDLLKIFEIEKRIFGDDKFDIMLLRDLVQQAIQFLILEEATSSDMLGFCITMQMDPQDTPGSERHSAPQSPTTHIVNIAIDTPYQHRGLGKMLLQHCLEEMKQLRYQKVLLEVNTANWRAISLYKQFGFQQGEFLSNYYRSGADAYRMEKILQNN